MSVDEVPPLDPVSLAALERTRSAVLNVLVVAGMAIAVGGLLLRWRDQWGVDRIYDPVGVWLTRALVGLMVASVLIRRFVCGRDSLRDPARRLARFYRGHVVSALLGASAVLLGVAEGWFVRPRLEAVAPFWVAGLALGALSFPRASVLQGFDAPPTVLADVTPGPPK